MEELLRAPHEVLKEPYKKLEEFFSENVVEELLRTGRKAAATEHVVCILYYYRQRKNEQALVHWSHQCVKMVPPLCEELEEGKESLNSILREMQIPEEEHTFLKKLIEVGFTQEYR